MPGSGPNTELDIVLSDAHFPYQDRTAINLVYEFIAKHYPGTIHLLGDLIDFYSISRHRREPTRKLSIQSDLNKLRDFLGQVRAFCPKSRIIYTEGNHEARLHKYLIDRAEELSPLDALSFPSLAGFADLNVEWRPESAPYCKNGLWFTHGDTVRKHAAYTARAHAEKVGGNVIIGHTHRLGMSPITTWGQHYVGWENGCLCTMRPEYIVGKPNWQQGFHAIQWHTGSRLFNVETVRILKGKALYRGELLEAA